MYPVLSMFSTMNLMPKEVACKRGDMVQSCLVADVKDEDMVDEGGVAVGTCVKVVWRRSN